MPNPTATVGPGQFASLPVSAKDSLGNPAPIHGSISISDYSKGYATGDATGIQITPTEGAGVGQSYLLSATMTAFAADNSALPPLQFDVTVQGPPPPPPATQLVTGSPTVAPVDPIHGTPLDPHSGTVTF